MAYTVGKGGVHSKPWGGGGEGFCDCPATPYGTTTGYARYYFFW